MIREVQGTGCKDWNLMVWNLFEGPFVTRLRLTPQDDQYYLTGVRDNFDN